MIAKIIYWIFRTIDLSLKTLLLIGSIALIGFVVYSLGAEFIKACKENELIVWVECTIGSSVIVLSFFSCFWLYDWAQHNKH